jgi:ectoine hydroxylase-related dioxygenase (phytanoyl-CoA dioxygenase family)
MLTLIFGERPRPYQTLTYVFGSEQQYHQDTIHLTPFPAGRMCGVWAALEDVQPDSGELIVYPKSHKLERVTMAAAGAGKVGEDWTEFGETVAARWGAMIQDHQLARETYRPQRGEVLIWHENLMHGGMVRREKSRSRRSIVGHYFADGAIIYHDSSGMPGVLHEDQAH